jgi:hypothetical protein
MFQYNNLNSCPLFLPETDAKLTDTKPITANKAKTAFEK